MERLKFRGRRSNIIFFNSNQRVITFELRLRNRNVLIMYALSELQYEIRNCNQLGREGRAGE
jgi:hypothetical protein